MRVLSDSFCQHARHDTVFLFMPRRRRALMRCLQHIRRFSRLFSLTPLLAFHAGCHADDVTSPPRDLMPLRYAPLMLHTSSLMLFCRLTRRQRVELIYATAAYTQECAALIAILL